MIQRLHILSILIKNSHVAQIILYYHVTKQFLPCLNSLVYCFWFQNMFWKNINCFRLRWKIYLKRCARNCVISQVKRLSSSALSSWSGAFTFRYAWTTKEFCISKDFASKTWQWKSWFQFCSIFVYFADLKIIYFVPCLCCSCKLF